jgi:organic radical activating enzyme
MNVEMSGKVYRPSTPDPAEATREAMKVAAAGLIPLVEIFYSLQGEGLRTGQATVFVRVAGCNLSCDFCDTDFRVKESFSVEALADAVDAISGDCRWVCLTGGEPTIHDLADLCDTLHSRGYRLQIETNGMRPKPEWRLDHTTVSPKQPQGGRLDPWYLDRATEFKYVVDGEDDLERALAGVAEHHKPTFLQPNSLNPDAVALCIAAVKAHPQIFRLSLQTHKFIDIR